MNVAIATLVLTGTVVNVAGQYLTSMGFASPSSQIFPWIRYGSTFVYALLSRIGKGGGSLPLSRRQQRLLTAIGLLDTVAYVLFTLGFYACGPAAAGLLLAACSQVLTAAASHWVLGKRLSRQQAIAVATIIAGLAIRAGNSSASHTAKEAPLIGQTTGVIALVMAAALYASMGVVYEALHSLDDGPTPTYSEISWHSSKLGFMLTSIYMALYTWPRRHELLDFPDPKRASPLLLVFSVGMNAHMACQAHVFKTSGAMGVALANAVRGAVLTLVTAALFCSPEKPWLCLNVHSTLSVAVILLGGYLWSTAKAHSQEAEEAQQLLEQLDGNMDVSDKKED